jgi:hypothetical protein
VSECVRDINVEEESDQLIEFALDLSNKIIEKAINSL